MDFHTYAAAAASTARYPDRGRNLYYPALGLSGETGEVHEKLASFLAAGEISADGYDLLAREFGDVLWYAATFCFEARLTLEEVTGVSGFEELQRSVAADEPLTISALHLAAATGALSERVKKVMRDRGGVVDDTARSQLSAALLLVLQHLASLASALGVELSTAASQNADKLADRMRRNRLSGEGDER